jgi:hypothetical protein
VASALAAGLVPVVGESVPAAELVLVPEHTLPPLQMGNSEIQNRCSHLRQRNQALRYHLHDHLSGAHGT